jgi:hypothetical protein
MVRRSAVNKEILERAAMWFASLTPVTQFLITGVIVVACFVATALAAKAAEMKIARDYGVQITITGMITDQDAKQFQTMAGELERADFAAVMLDSTGGNVSAAINIGRLIRKVDGWTTTIGKCYSSCALIFIAGVRRFNRGELGLHRPYFSAAPESRETIEKAVPLMLSTLKNYVAEMGITDRFYEQMVNTEPSQMVVYKGVDVAALVPEQDPVYAEIVVASEARANGVTTSEMRRRDKAAEENCRNRDVDSYMVCWSALRWGLSEQDYVVRNAKSKRECWSDDKHRFGEAEQTTIDKTPQKLKTELPFWIRRETCVRNVMLGRSVPAQSSWFSWLFGR